jgi:uncharacterized protein (TIGR00251 family)
MLLKVMVKPSSGKSEIVDKGDYLLVFLKAPAEKGRANAELVRLLSGKYEKVRIVRGLKSRKKIVSVQ